MGGFEICLGGRKGRTCRWAGTKTEMGRGSRTRQSPGLELWTEALHRGVETVCGGRRSPAVWTLQSALHSACRITALPLACARRILFFGVHFRVVADTSKLHP